MNAPVLSIVSRLMGGFDWEQMLLSLPAIILAICVHEYCHARVAYALGDPTAKYMGRMTLNPIKHFHPVGFILMLTVHVGFAKPVPINPSNFKNPKRDEILTALAGPASNIVMAAVFTVLAKIYFNFWFGGSLPADVRWPLWIAYILIYGISINIGLAIFNMIPVPPLDGSHILTVLMPDSWRPYYNKVQPFMPYIFIALWLTGIMSSLVSVPMNALMDLIWKFLLS